MSVSGRRSAPITVPIGSLPTSTAPVARHYNKAYLSIQTPDVLARIGQGDSSWEELVPPAVAEMIKMKGLFGYRAAAVASPDVR